MKYDWVVLTHCIWQNSCQSKISLDPTGYQRWRLKSVVSKSL